jgi:hypothetical protein
MWITLSRDMMMNDAFIERRMELGEASEVVLRFARPIPHGQDFRCEYAIIWPSGTRSTRAFFGVDAVQALIVAMKAAHSELLASAEARSGQLQWLGTPDLGLPLPDGLTPKDFEWLILGFGVVVLRSCDQCTDERCE